MKSGALYRLMFSRVEETETMGSAIHAFVRKLKVWLGQQLEPI